MLASVNNNPAIEVDGGVNATNAPKLKAAGATALVAGNFVFSSSNPKETIQELKLSVNG
jgi:ribulose-phosphate 3-epimerase